MSNAHNPDGGTKSFVVVLHVPARLVGRPMEEIERLLQAQSVAVIRHLAVAAFDSINNPNLSLEKLTESLQTARIQEAFDERERIAAQLRKDQGL